MSEARQLIDAYCDGVATDAEIDQLRKLLETSDEVAIEFVQRMELHGQLQWELGVGLPSVLPELLPEANLRKPASVKDATRNSKWRWRSVTVAMATIFLISVWIFWPRGKPPQPEGPSHFAVVESVTHAVWAGPSRAVGDAIRAERISLERGFVKLRLAGGATVLLEAPAEMSVTSGRSFSLQTGKVFVQYTPENSEEKPLVVQTPTAEIRDLGTEFGVHHTPQKATIVQVYQGEVDVMTTTAKGSPRQRVPAGKAVAATISQNTWESVPFFEERFAKQSPSLESFTTSGLLWNTQFDSDLEIRPSPWDMTIDGELGEWQTADSVFLRGDGQPDVFAEVFLLADWQHLYVAAVVKDSHGMANRYDPDRTPQDAWKGGGLQVELRNSIKAAEKRRQLLIWYHAASGTPSLHVTGEDEISLTNPPGMRATFVRAKDGESYTLEYAIPWKSLGLTAPMRPSQWRGKITVYWSDPSGRFWRGQVSNISAGEPLGTFSFPVGNE